MLCFDIETGPRSEDELRAIVEPFNAAGVKGLVLGEFDPSTIKGLVIGEFDPATVKLGRMTDQEKINDKLNQAKLEFEQAKAESVKRVEHARAEHEAGLANNVNLVEQARAEYWQSCLSRAALSPLTGRVLAIGYYAADKDKVAISGVDSPADEPKLLAAFWKKYNECRSQNRQQFGFNIFGFDLPFMARRSWLLGVDVPGTLMDASGRYFDRMFIDLLVRWRCGGSFNESIKLSALANYFGVGGKPDGITGADFARLWSTDREQATAYLVNDLRITAACAARMGFV